MFCDDCSDFRLLTRDPKDPSVVISVRACRPCFDKFRGRKMRGAKAKAGQAAASPAVHKVQRNSRAAEAEKSHTQPEDPHTKHEVEMEPAEPDSEDILNIPADALASVKNSTLQQHHHYEGEDADITGTETIRVDEDEDHQVYPDNNEPHAHSEDGHTIKLFTVLGADGKVVDVDRDQVMATQGSVVLPSKTAVGGLQFVNVDNSHSAARPSAATATTTATTASTTATTATTAGLPSDTAAVFQKSDITARTPSNAINASNVSNTSNIVFHPVDKENLIVSPVAGSGGEKDEFDRSSVGALEGSEEEILNIPSDALASVKNSTLMARQQQQGEQEGEVAWSDRNVENRFAPASPTNAVPMLFNEDTAADGEQQKSANRVV